MQNTTSMGEKKTDNLLLASHNDWSHIDYYQLASTTLDPYDI
jgi:hypothetical protein